MARRRKFSLGLALFLAIVCFIIGACGGFYGYFQYTLPEDSDVFVSGDLEIHFLELGNKYTGDCVYVKMGDTDLLIDAGSKVSSIPTIAKYLNEHMTDDIIEYAIVTHAHEDHYAGFATNEKTDSLFDIYEFEVIIDFAQITKGKETGAMYNHYIRERDAEIAAAKQAYQSKLVSLII